MSVGIECGGRKSPRIGEVALASRRCFLPLPPKTSKMIGGNSFVGDCGNFRVCVHELACVYICMCVCLCVSVCVLRLRENEMMVLSLLARKESGAETLMPAELEAGLSVLPAETPRPHSSHIGIGNYLCTCKPSFVYGLCLK